MFGIGVFNLLMSYIPVSVLNFFKLIGINPNKEEGIKYLSLCLDLTDGYRSCYAALALCIHFMDYELDYDSVCKILHIFLKDFPESTLFLWIASLIASKFS